MNGYNIAHLPELERWQARCAELETQRVSLAAALKESNEVIEMLLLFHRDVFNDPTLATIARVSKGAQAALREAGVES